MAETLPLVVSISSLLAWYPEHLHRNNIHVYFSTRADHNTRSRIYSKHLMYLILSCYFCLSKNFVFLPRWCVCEHHLFDIDLYKIRFTIYITWHTTIRFGMRTFQVIPANVSATSRRPIATSALAMACPVALFPLPFFHLNIIWIAFSLTLRWSSSTLSRIVHESPNFLPSIFQSLPRSSDISLRWLSFTISFATGPSGTKTKKVTIREQLLH